jgi:hypothetical protein
MLLNYNEYTALPPNCRWYQMLLDMDDLLTKPTGLRHLVMLSAVNKETRRRFSFFLKRFIKQKRVFYPGNNSKLLLFDAERHYMTIRCIEDDIFKVCHAGVNYVVTKDLSSAHFANPGGYTYHPSISFDEVYRLLIQDLHVKRSMRQMFRRLDVPVKMPFAKIWFENMDNTPHALLGRLNLRIHVDFKQMHLMATARHWFNRRYRDDKSAVTGEGGVHLCIWLRCVKFD